MTGDSPIAVLAQGVSRAVIAAYGPDHVDIDPLLRPSQFADFQSNVALPLAKVVSGSSREVAWKIADYLDLEDICEAIEISGPGFINFTVRNSWIARQLSAVAVGTAANRPAQRS